MTQSDPFSPGKDLLIPQIFEAARKDPEKIPVDLSIYSQRELQYILDVVKGQSQDWMPLGPSKKALMSRCYEIMMGGARGGMKSETGTAWLVDPNYIYSPRYRGLVIRVNAEDLKDWVDRASVFYRRLGAKVVGRPPEIRFPSGAILRTGHLKDDLAYTKYLGHEYQKIYIEELTLIPDEKNYLSLITSCRSTIPGLQPQVFSTTNPLGPGHQWVKRRFVDNPWGQPHTDPETGMDRVFVPSRITDNPVLMVINPEYYFSLKGLPEDERRAYLDGDWDIMPGQFFSEFRRDIHVIKPFRVPDYFIRYWSLDWGATGGFNRSGNFCVLEFAVDPDSQKIYIIDEYYAQDKPTKENALWLKRNWGYKGKPQRVIADPSIFDTRRRWIESTDRSIAQALRQYAGIDAKRGNRNKILGWAAVKDALHWEKNRDNEFITEPALYIFEDRAPNLVRTLTSIMKHDSNPHDIAPNQEDDPADTARYGLLHIRKPNQKSLSIEAPWGSWEYWRREARNQEQYRRETELH